MDWVPESGSAYSPKLQINFKMNEVHVTQNQEYNRHQAPQKALLSTIHSCFLLEKTHTQQFSKKNISNMFLLEALYCSVCSSVLFHFPMTRPICFLQNKDNILLAVETTSYHAAIMKMLSRRKHFTAEKKSSYHRNLCGPV